jgi:hypothetical protein
MIDKMTTKMTKVTLLRMGLESRWGVATVNILRVLFPAPIRIFACVLSTMMNVPTVLNTQPHRRLCCDQSCRHCIEPCESERHEPRNYSSDNERERAPFQSDRSHGSMSRPPPSPREYIRYVRARFCREPLYHSFWTNRSWRAIWTLCLTHTLTLYTQLGL